MRGNLLLKKIPKILNGKAKADHLITGIAQKEPIKNGLHILIGIALKEDILMACLGENHLLKDTQIDINIMTTNKSMGMVHIFTTLVKKKKKKKKNLTQGKGDIEKNLIEERKPGMTGKKI